MSAQPKDTTDMKEMEALHGKTITPEVTWAQRSSASEAEKNHIFLTIAVPDVSKDQIKLDIQPTQLSFQGYSDTKKATYAVELQFYAEIDKEQSKINHTPRDIELVLQKKELNEEYWPRLLKDKAKVHFLKTNFDKWVDEDEQDAIQDDDDYMSRMGGMGGGMGGDGGFGGIDFSKLGGAGAGGMEGMGGMGMDEDEEDDAEDDDDMPELEDDENAKEGAKAGEASGSKKIEEVE